MSTSANTKIVTSGLVFYYDMTNGKSFIGGPTTNLAYTGVTVGSEGINTWTNSGAATLNTNETDISKPSIPYSNSLSNDIKILSGLCTTSGGIHCGPFGVTTVSASTAYTISVWFRQNRAGSTSPYMRTNVNNNSLGNFSYNGDTNSGNWPINKWIRITCTGTTQSNENGIYLSNYLGTAGDKIWYYGYQVEAGSVATGFTTGIRSNTQGLLDLTNSKIITINSLTYTSDSTFNFNGSSNYLSIPSVSDAALNSGSWTISAWVKFSAVSKGSDNMMFGHGSGAANSGLHLCERGSIIYFGMYANDLGSSTVLTANTWYNVVFVFDYSSKLKTIYLNGSYNTSGGSVGYSGTGSNFSIGSFFGSYLNGSMPVVQIYNRALLASEVRQNFIAVRSRFGI